tara:strand:+ start:7327 stop:7572 length:246 start_codon:yes stop_codon:yes gene_type:complete
MNKEEKRERIVGLLQAVRHSNNDIQKVADQIMAIKKRKSNKFKNDILFSWTEIRLRGWVAVFLNLYWVGSILAYIIYYMIV